jgi:hypothetical protein
VSPLAWSEPQRVMRAVHGGADLLAREITALREQVARLSAVIEERSDTRT